MFHFFNNFFSKREKIKLVFFIGKEISNFQNPNLRKIDEDWGKYPLSFIYDYKNYSNNKDNFLEFYNEKIKYALRSNIQESYKQIIAPLIKIQSNNRFEVYFITDSLDYFLENNGLQNVLHINGLLGDFICSNEFCLYRSKNKKWSRRSCPKCKKNTIRPCINFLNEYDKPFEEIEKINKILKTCDLYVQCYTQNEMLFNLLNDNLVKLLIINKEGQQVQEEQYFFNQIYQGNEINVLKKINNIKNINNINSFR